MRELPGVIRGINVLARAPAAFIRRAARWGYRRLGKPVLARFFFTFDAAVQQATFLQRNEPGISAPRFVARHLCSSLLRSARRRIFGSVPTDRARAAMFLGQTLDMLNLAAEVLENFQKNVCGDLPDVPPLVLTRRVRDRILSAGDTPVFFLRRATTESPNYAEAWCELGRLLMQSGKMDESISAFGRVTACTSYADPARNPESIYNIANGVYDKALVWMGQALEKNGDETGALMAYTEALVFKADSSPASLALADLHFRRGALEATIKYCTASMYYLPPVAALPRQGRNLDALAELIEEHLRVLGHTSANRDASTNA